VIDPAQAAHLPTAAQRLFVRLASTAISDDGVADDFTLRTIEAAVPVPIAGEVEWIAPEPPGFDWVAVLDAICAATPAFGKGKLDGYGRAVARAEPISDPPATVAKPAASGAAPPAGPIDLELLLWPERRATFSARSATEGAQRTRLAPTGAALLGWCAAEGRYARFKNSEAVFHDGSVRFQDAHPLPSHAEEVVPVPQSFVAPKGQEGAATDAARLDRRLVRNGRPPLGEDEHQQYEAIDRSGWMTTGYGLLGNRPRHRLRTATRNGRAAEGQLFGFEHVEPGQVPYVARIRIGANVDAADVARIAEAFLNRTLHLGRGRNTGSGGAYRCRVTWRAPDADEMLPAGTRGRIAVLALSDIAAISALGAPAPFPDPDDLGLPGAAFLPRASAIGHRRYAPWNATLGRRDSERLVIEAGSVMVYSLDQPLAAPVPRRRTVGAWQEVGLGRVWIDPPFLSAWELPEVQRGAPLLMPAAPDGPAAGGWMSAEEAAGLCAWAGVASSGGEAP
jgi:hypothetical protein